MSVALRRLEFPALLEILAHHILSEPGRERLARLVPFSDIEDAEIELRRVESMQKLIESGVRLDFSAIPDVGRKVAKLGTGAGLTSHEILSLAQFIAATDEIYDKIVGTELEALMPDPSFLRPFVKEIFRKIDEDGELRDDASEKLAKLRQEKRRRRQEVVNLLNSLMDKYYRQGLLRERIVTMRGGRFVLPFASHVKPRGVVHGFSHTEETIYVEPFESIEAQNRYVRIVDEEREEAERILRELAERMHQFAPTVKALWDSIGELELVYAKAEFASAFGCITPKLNRSGRIVLKEARHPLLIETKGFENVVPLDLKLGPKPSVLLISGPNAGGKTVALKTVGLLTLMAMAGIPVPAKSADLFFPDRVFAIGFEDVQDIEHGESSFTALLHEVKDVLDYSDGRALVLLDEFLASTDPSEGAALAFAILKNLRDLGHIVLANTHLTPLKILVEREDGMINARVLFDPLTKRPTYRLQVGEMGSSYALEIAKQVGLPDDVLSEAESVLVGMERELRELTKRLKKREAELVRKLAEIAQKERELERREAKLTREAKLKARQIIESAREEAEGLVRELRKELRRKRKLEEQIAVAKAVRDQLKEKSLEFTDLYRKKAEILEIGKSYRVKPFGFIGELVELRGGNAVLKVGKQRIEVPKDSLYEI